jgi:hypothetical protein
VLLGLERGEQVGTKTLAKIEQELGWPVGWSQRVLAGEVVGLPSEDTLPPAMGLTTDDLLVLIRRQREELAVMERALQQRAGGAA